MQLPNKALSRFTVVLCFAFSYSSHALAEDKKSELIRLAGASPKCDEAKVTELLKQVKMDDVVLFALAQKGCTKPIGSIIGLSQAMQVRTARLVLKDWQENYYPTASKNLTNGELPDQTEITGRAYGLGWIGGVCEVLCKKFKNNEACTISEEINQSESQYNELNAALKHK